MNLIILGAGASHDSNHLLLGKKGTSKWRPPLSNELLGTQKMITMIL